MSSDDAQARDHLAAILEYLPDFVIRVDRKGTIQFANRPLPIRPATTSEGIVGTFWLSRVPNGPQRDELQSALAGVLETGESRVVAFQVVGDDGAPRWLECHIGPLRRDGEIAGAVAIARDVSEKKRAEAQLIASDRLAAVGTLAAGVAHEINNPLASVLANVELALQAVEHAAPGDAPQHDLVDGLRDARDGAVRIRSIVRDLMVFSRADEDRTRPVNARAIFESMLRMAGNEIRHRARLVAHYGEVPDVEANESRLGQVLLNLLVNAAQALPEGRADANEIRVATSVDAAGRVVFEVADTGTGMPPDVLKHIFDPFFTTKPVGGGMGVGLAICHRIVAAHGGTIEVESEPGKGSVFRVHLPAALPDATRGSRATDAAQTTHRRGRVLVIDDDAKVGAVLRRALSREHEVFATTRAAEALDLLARGERFDVILCDLMMPDITGPEFHEALVQRWPELVGRVIFMTGGAFTPRARAFLERVGTLRLEKPFDSARVLELINDRMR
jgi:PAS domain S-box-containing protein